MNATEYEELYQIMFRDGYRGFVPAVAEAPNGDGKIDVQKRYSHFAKKYRDGLGLEDQIYCDKVFSDCLARAREYAQAMRIPGEFWPTAEDSTLRLLEYPAGATSAEHTDFDLFTINLYRSHRHLIVPQFAIHHGELAEIISGGWLKATTHHVEAHPTQTQRSAVFFAMPPLKAVLPTGQTVLEWLTERKTRSRVYR